MKMSQEQFAIELGVRQQTVSEWENGRYLPKRSMSKLLTFLAIKANFDS
jgi:DNA-binding transcriptional regulator YiaG